MKKKNMTVDPGVERMGPAHKTIKSEFGLSEQ